VLRDGNAFWSFLRASWPAERERFRVGPKAASKTPLLGRSFSCSSELSFSNTCFLGADCQGDGSDWLTSGSALGIPYEDVGGCWRCVVFRVTAGTIGVQSGAWSSLDGEGGLRFPTSSASSSAPSSSSGTAVSKNPPFDSFSRAAAFSTAGVFCDVK
jgi:hypothetical protein